MRIALVLLVVTRAAAEQRLAVEIPMRDGVRLSSNVFLPETTGRFSSILIRTPYGKGSQLIASYRTFLDNRYALVIQDVRGRYASEGKYRNVMQEMPDGDDTVSWIAKQPWSDGKVAMTGGSYLGIAQWRAGLSHNPHLMAIFPVVAGSDEFRDRFYSPGGLLKLGHRLHWISENFKLPWPFRPDFNQYVRHVPLRTADKIATGQTSAMWQEALNHPEYDGFWKSRSIREQLGSFNTPAFIVGGWYDNYVEGDLEAFSFLSRRSPAYRIVVGPWPHSMSAPYPSGITFGPNAGAPIRRYQLDWFQYWLRTTRPEFDFPYPRVRLFVMGIDRWRNEDEWPLRRTRMTPMYFSSESGANSIRGDGKLNYGPLREGRDRFVYDPKKPVPTAGGSLCCNPKVLPWGPMDQRLTEARDDVLVYTSAPLQSDLEVTGSVRVVLHISTTATDTDFTAKLVDVYPNGYARNLCDGALRLRYREGLEQAKLATPGKIYSVAIPAGVTSNVFRTGHRIRVDISSSNFPRFDRNPNTGRSIADELELRIARQTVYHGRLNPSRIELPVIPQ